MQRGVTVPDDRRADSRFVDSSGLIRSPADGQSRMEYSHKVLKLVQIDMSNTDLLTGVTYNVAGTVLMCPYSTNLTDVVWVQFNDDSDFIPFPRGAFLSGIPFSKITVKVTANLASTFNLVYATDGVFDEIRVQ
jgi:hypothetical protein